MAVKKPNTYVGLNNEIHGGMTSIGKIIRDAWVFGLLPETETCEGWAISRLDVLHDQVNQEWDKYGCLVSRLPEDLSKRHQEIYAEAIKKAKEAGWSGEAETDEDT